MTQASFAEPVLEEVPTQNDSLLAPRFDSTLTESNPSLDEQETQKTTQATADQQLIDVLIPSDQTLILDLIQKGYFEYPENRQFLPQEPLSRAEYITLLYRSYELNTPFISDFPYYRDVETSHWAYQPIEAFRMVHWLDGMPEDGYFNPENPISIEDAAIILHRSMPARWIRLPLTEVPTVMGSVADEMDLYRVETVLALARSIKGDLIPFNKTAHANQFKQPLTRLAGAHLINQLDAIHRQTYDDGQQIYYLPAGMSLTVSPARAIMLAELEPNTAVDFVLQQPVSVTLEAQEQPLYLEPGSRVSGHIVSLAKETNQASALLDSLQLPGGQTYLTNASVNLTFQTLQEVILASPDEDKQKKSKSKKSKAKKDNAGNDFVVVPGQIYTVVTEAPKSTRQTP